MLGWLGVGEGGGFLHCMLLIGQLPCGQLDNSHTRQYVKMLSSRWISKGWTLILPLLRDKPGLLFSESLTSRHRSRPGGLRVGRPGVWSSPGPPFLDRGTWTEDHGPEELTWWRTCISSCLVLGYLKQGEITSNIFSHLHDAASSFEWKVPFRVWEWGWEITFRSSLGNPSGWAVQTLSLPRELQYVGLNGSGATVLWGNTIFHANEIVSPPTSWKVQFAAVMQILIGNQERSLPTQEESSILS